MATALDNLLVPDPVTGKPLQRLGIGAQFSFADGHLPAVREAVMSVMKSDFAQHSENFQRWQGSASSRHRCIVGGLDSLADQERATLMHDPDKPFGPVLQDRAAPPHWQVWSGCLPRDERRRPLSYLSISMPPSTVLADPAGYIAQVLHWAEMIRPQYGSAGFCLVDEAGMAQHRRGACYPWLRRYPGLDLPPFNVQDKPARYQSINWLTVLDESVIASLGGTTRLAEKLAEAAEAKDVPAAVLTAYDGGALITACSLPLLCDGEPSGSLASYRAVNQVLRRAQFEDYPPAPSSQLIDAPRGEDARLATLDWVRRFDAEQCSPRARHD